MALLGQRGGELVSFRNDRRSIDDFLRAADRLGERRRSFVAKVRVGCGATLQPGRGALPTELYFEDLQPGMRFNSDRSYKVTAEEIKEFAERYDPQPFHLDEAAGESSFFQGLAASGWLTAAIVMRLRVESLHIAGGIIGAGVEEMRWTRPVRPGDTLQTEAEILTTRLSHSRPSFGVVQSRTTTLNQRNEVVMRSVVNFLAPLRGMEKAG